MFRATKLRPYYSECFRVLGDIYLHFENEKLSSRCYAKCLNLNIQNENAVFSMYQLYSKLKLFSESEKLLKEACEQYDSSIRPRALFHLGLHYFHQKDYNKAAHSIQTVDRLISNNIHNLEVLADIYFRRGSYGSALKVNEKICILDSNNLMAKLQIGNIKIILRSYNEAINVFDEIISVDEYYIPALRGMAVAHYGLAKTFRAEKMLGRCKDHLQSAVNYLERILIYKQTNFVWFWRMLAEIFCMAGCLPESKAFLSVLKVLVSNKKQNIIDEHELTTIKGEKLFIYAKKYFVCALNINSNDHLSWCALAQCCYKYSRRFGDEGLKLWNINSAIKACKESIKINSSRMETWNLLGVLYGTTEKNNILYSQHCFIKALNIRKKVAMPWSNIGIMYLSQAEINLAHKCFSRSQQINPSYANAWAGQGIIAEYLGVNDESMDLFRHSLRLRFNFESALSFGNWVCSILFKPESFINDKYFKGVLKNPVTVSTALDSLTWCFNEKEKDFSVEALSHLAYLNFKLGLCKQATKYYEIAVEIISHSNKNNNDDGALNRKIKNELLCNLGYMYLKINQYENAINTFNSISKLDLNSAIGLGLAYSKSSKMEESYSTFSLALKSLAFNEKDKLLILMEMTTILYLVKGEQDAKQLLFQILSFNEKPIESLYFACALSIIHEDWELAEAVIDEFKKFENQEEICYHISFLASCFYSKNNEIKEGLNYLVKSIHRFPNHAYLRKLLIIYLLENFKKIKNLNIGAYKTVQSIILLITSRPKTVKMLIEPQLSKLKASEISELLLLEYITNKNLSKKITLIQKAIRINPLCKEAWMILRSFINSK